VFGNGTFISEFAEHAVKVHDFEATVVNLARLEKLSEIVPPAGETADERQARLDLRDAYRTSMQERLTRLTESRAAAVRKADAELTRLELLSNDKRRSNRPSTSELEKARRILKHHRDLNVIWSPNIAASLSQREVAPPAKLLYAQKMLSVQQTLWEKLFKKELAAELFGALEALSTSQAHSQTKTSSSTMSSSSRSAATNYGASSLASKQRTSF